MYLGMSEEEAEKREGRGTDEGGKLKEVGTTHWSSPNTRATNENGFTALPGGYRNSNGAFYHVGNHGYWWSSTQDKTNIAWIRGLYYHGSLVNRDSRYNFYGFSVRCVRD